MLSAYVVPSVRADEWNKETHLTINVPLQIEDTVLAPGEYVFKLVEPETDRDIVSIFNSDGTRLETTIMGGRHTGPTPVTRTCSRSLNLTGANQPRCKPGSILVITSEWNFRRQRELAETGMSPEPKTRDKRRQRRLMPRRPVTNV
jgi:hypothetical protein